MTFSLDANILIYSMDVSSVDRRSTAADFVADIANTGLGFLTLQAIAEMANVLRRKGVPPDDIQEKLDILRLVFPIRTAIPGDLDDALWAVEHHKLAFWDAMLWATCRRAGCSVLFTEDFQDGRILKGVRFVDPFKAKNARYLPKV